MKKFVCLVLIEILMLQSVCISASDVQSHTGSTPITRLKKFSDFSDAIDAVLTNEDGKITRRDALTMIMNLFFAPSGGIAQMHSATVQQEKVSDVENGSVDCTLVKYAASFGFLNGTEIDGRLCANLDANITYYEALEMMSRLFKNEDGWYSFVCESGIVDASFDMEKQYEEIPADAFLECFYKMLYVPYERNTYGGVSLDSYIRKLIVIGDETELDDSVKAVETIEGLCIADTSLYEDVTQLPRYDALALLVRSMGMMVTVSFGSDYSTQFRPKQYITFADLDSINENYREWYLSTRYARQGALYFATLIPDFVYGVGVNKDGVANFDTDRAITAKEAVAFMVRLLNCPNVDKKDIDATYAHAFDIGLLKKTDAFVQNPDAPLSPEEYFIILHRFLYQPKHIYYGSEFVHFATGGGEDWILMDKEGTETYFDYLCRVVPQLLQDDALMSGSHLVTYK